MALTLRTQFKFWESSNPTAVGYGDENANDWWHDAVKNCKPDCIGTARRIISAYNEANRLYGHGTLWGYTITDARGNEYRIGDLRDIVKGV